MREFYTYPDVYGCLARLGFLANPQNGLRSFGMRGVNVYSGTLDNVMICSKTIYPGLVICAVTLLISSCTSLRYISDTDYIHYQKAIEIIFQEDKYCLLPERNDNYSVSGEFIDFFSIGGIFSNELQAYMEMDQLQLVKIISSSRSNLQEPDLEKLGTKKRALTRIYISTIEQGFFAIEIVNSRRPKTLYEDRLSFGTSYVYLFQIGSEVVLKNAIEVANN